MTGQIRVAIVGAGRGGDGHGIGHFIFREFQRNEHTVPVAVVGRTARCAGRHRDSLIAQGILDSSQPIIPCGQRKFRALLAEAMIDAVVIACPDRHHLYYLEHCVNSGKDVFIEKPIAPLAAFDSASGPLVSRVSRLFAKAGGQGSHIITNCQRAYVPKFLEQHGIDMRPKVRLRLFLGFSMRSEDGFFNEHGLFSMCGSHLVSILVKMGIDNPGEVRFLSKSMEHSSDHVTFSIRFRYAGKVDVEIVLQQFARSATATTEIQVDTGQVIAVSGHVEPGSGNFVTVYDIGGVRQLFSEDLLRISVDRFVDGMLSGNADECLISNKEGLLIHELEQALWKHMSV